MASRSRAEGRRLPVPTRRLIKVGGALFGLGLLTPLAPPLAIVWRAGLGLLGLLLALDLALRPRAGSVTGRRELSAHYHVARDGEYSLELRNGSDRALAVAIGETLPAALEGDGLQRELVLDAGEQLTLRVPFVGLERGAHPLPAPAVRLGHPWGLLAYQEELDLGDEVVVAPGRPPGETEWLLTRVALIEEQGRRTLRRPGSADEFESLREYVVGDELRRIDWKASARRVRPLVRQYQTERNAEVILALDCGRLMGSLIDGVSKLDLTMTPLLDLAAVALRRGERLGFLGFDSRPRAFLPPRAGLDKLRSLTHTLGTLPRGDEPTSFLRAIRYLEANHRKRTLVVIFTDFTDELSARDLYAGLAALTRRHVVVFVGVSDPHLDRLAWTEARDTRSLFERAVACDLVAERRRTLSRLERLGLFTVDAEPNRLSGPLIRRFLEVRLRGVV